MKTVIRHLRRAALLQEGDSLADGQLLELFLAGRDEAAFEALMRRHGPMVLGVCRRLLRNNHDAEDAFQATFLVLVRKAGSLRSRELLANWLYGVAYRTALKARTMNAKRQAKERHAGAMPHSESSASGADEALLEQLDHELNRLPHKYRVPVVFCELEGKSRKEVARLLGVPEGTLSSRLAYAKKLLSTRLSRRGVALSVGAFAAVLSPTLRASTLKTVFSAGSVPAQVLALTEGMMKAMFLSKLRITVCAATLMLVAGVGATGLTYRATAQQPAQSPAYGAARDNRPQADDLEALRLEIESLRRELRAMSVRVKELEGKAEQRATTQGRIRAASGERASLQIGKGQVTEGSTAPVQIWRRRAAPAVDPVSEAEAALKKLRENPSDTKATEELERALKKLKEQKKPEVPGQGNRL
jgi:RNA polymerase sigma factor (sigma-70 family)